MRYWILFVLFFACHGHTEGNTPAELMLFDAARERPIKTYLWYPKAACPQTHCLAPSAHVAAPVVLSHGAMGSPLEYSWLAEALANNGYIVVGIAHFGESWVYGQDSVQPHWAAEFWRRTADVSYVLDAFSQQNPFDRKVNWQNATGVGHSSGGQTLLALAGVEFSTDQIKQYCQSSNSPADRGCRYGQGIAPSAEFIASFTRSHKDPRVTRVVALDPALGAAAIDTSLKSTSTPTLIIGAQHNDFLPFKYHSAYYAEHMPNAELHALTGNEGHFVFLNACTHNYQAQGVSLCKDAQGVDRAQTHEQLTHHILQFLNAKPFE